MITFFNVPRHSWMNVRFQAVIIDKWQGNTLLLETSQDVSYNTSTLSNPKQIWNGTFDYFIR